MIFNDTCQLYHFPNQLTPYVYDDTNIYSISNQYRNEKLTITQSQNMMILISSNNSDDKDNSGIHIFGLGIESQADDQWLFKPPRLLPLPRSLPYSKLIVQQIAASNTHALLLIKHNTISSNMSTNDSSPSSSLSTFLYGIGQLNPQSYSTEFIRLNLTYDVKYIACGVNCSALITLGTNQAYTWGSGAYYRYYYSMMHDVYSTIYLYIL